MITPAPYANVASRKTIAADLFRPLANFSSGRRLPCPINRFRQSPPTARCPWPRSKPSAPGVVRFTQCLPKWRRNAGPPSLPGSHHAASHGNDATTANALAARLHSLRPNLSPGFGLSKMSKLLDRALARSAAFSRPSGFDDAALRASMMPPFGLRARPVSLGRRRGEHDCTNTTDGGIGLRMEGLDCEMAPLPLDGQVAAELGLSRPAVPRPAVPPAPGWSRGRLRRCARRRRTASPCGHARANRAGPWRWPWASRSW